MYSTTPYMFDASTRPGFEALTQRVHIPLFGCDCYAYGASGGVGAFPHIILHISFVSSSFSVYKQACWQVASATWCVRQTSSRTITWRSLP